MNAGTGRSHRGPATGAGPVVLGGWGGSGAAKAVRQQAGANAESCGLPIAAPRELPREAPARARSRLCLSRKQLAQTPNTAPGESDAVDSTRGNRERR